jgi:hypothetical protein
MASANLLTSSDYAKTNLMKLTRYKKVRNSWKRKRLIFLLILLLVASLRKACD